MTIQTLRHRRLSVLFAVLLLISPLLQTVSRSQELVSQPTATDGPANLSNILRIEKIEVAGGAELITVHARLGGLESDTNDKWVPMVSILRDTLGDLNSENDRLRYVWPLTYTRPTLKQRLAAAIPFFYTRVGSKDKFSKEPPPPASSAGPGRKRLTDSWSSSRAR